MNGSSSGGGGGGGGGRRGRNTDGFTNQQEYISINDAGDEGRLGPPRGEFDRHSSRSTPFSLPDISRLSLSARQHNQGEMMGRYYVSFGGSDDRQPRESSARPPPGDCPRRDSGVALGDEMDVDEPSAYYADAYHADAYRADAYHEDAYYADQEFLQRRYRYPARRERPYLYSHSRPYYRNDYRIRSDRRYYYEVDSRRDRDREHYSRRDDRGDRDRDRGDRRRRSRSPHHRRREYEQDSYSSSRNYREREREDRYRDSRRDDRAWDRERGSGAAGGGGFPRRDFEERPPHREREPHREPQRDLFEDRRGGRRDRDEMGGRDRRERKRSATPPVVREPTPDLTDVVSILIRPRRLTQWDIKPAGYDNITAEQAKLSGMFPLPGAPRQQVMDPSRLQAFMNQPQGSAATTALKTTNARGAKRLFARNFSRRATNDTLQEWFNLQMNDLNVVSGQDPCVSALISEDHSYALLEFKTPEDATVAMALEGIQMDADASGPLEIERPKDYIMPATEPEEYQPGRISSVVKDTPNKLLVYNISIGVPLDDFIKLLESAGPLAAYVAATDKSSDQFRGFAFCEYVDKAHTDIAIKTLSGLDIAGQDLKIKRASVGTAQAAGFDSGVQAMTLLASSEAAEADQGRVIQLLNMVTAEELMDNMEYSDIKEDIQEECSKYGKILSMKIPRPRPGNRAGPGIGKIFIKYEDAGSAQKAMNALAGRQFALRTVVVTHFSEEYFDIDAW